MFSATAIIHTPYSSVSSNASFCKVLILISSSWSRVLSDEVYALVTSQEVNEIRPLRREGTLRREISNLFALNFELLKSFLHS